MLLAYFKRFTLIVADVKRITNSQTDHEGYSSNMVNGKRRRMQ